MDSDEVRFTVSYYCGGVDIGQDDECRLLPVIGNGLHWRGDFYRIVDVWDNREKHAPVDFGIVAFLEEVATPDVFREVNPRYYA